MKKRLLIASAMLCFIVAAIATAFPVFSNIYVDKHRSEIKTEYFRTIETIDSEQLDTVRKAAQTYNEMISNGVVISDGSFSDNSMNAVISGYADLLNINGDGIMAYIDIPRLGIYLPVGHGTDADTLEHFVGHVMGTSLPIGGESTHAALSGHSGLATERMFSDLDQLKEGDVFLVHVLNETLAYQVDQINVVLPGDAALLSITKGKDYVTLITCTPFGVNSHRLLVRGKRTAYVPSEEDTDTDSSLQDNSSDSTWKRHYIFGLFFGMTLFALPSTAYLFWRTQKKKSKHRHLKTPHWKKQR